jgi:hypothetical protein
LHQAKPFIASTASGPPLDLAISLVSFTGNWNQQYPALQWVVDQTGGTVTFRIESSPDGSRLEDDWNGERPG